MADPLTAKDVGRAERIAALDWRPTSLEFDTVRCCNLCESSHLIEVGRRDRYGYPLRCCLCARCGLGFLSPRPSAESYSRFYKSVYRPLVSAFHGRLIDARTVQDEQREYALGLVDFLEKSLPDPPKTVLDVGGSTGVVARDVSAPFGAVATVLDPSPAELDVAAATGLETILGFVEDAELGARRFDLVLLCQTIDHLLDVSGALTAIRSWLAAGGHAFVDILDFDFVLSRTGAVERAIKVDHPYYLARDTAQAYFELSGLAVKRERLSDDGHWGFLLEAAEPGLPNWDGLARQAEDRLRRIGDLRASGTPCECSA